MNCPKCGLEILADQRFCRVCGKSLQMTTQPLAERAAMTNLESRPVTLVEDEKQRANKLMPWGFIIMFIGVAVGVIGKKLMHEDLVTVLGVLVSLAGMFLTVYRYLWPSPRQKSDTSPSSQVDILVQSQPGKYLPPESNIEFVPSITERTTSLLTNSAATKPKQHEDGESQA